MRQGIRQAKGYDRLIIFGLIYLSLLHLALFVMFIKCDELSRYFGIAEADELPAYHRQMLAFQLRMDANLPSGSVLFIGDSLVQGLCTLCVSSAAINLGIAGDTTYGVLSRLPQYQALASAKAVVLSVGLNDLLKGRDSTSVLNNYKKILRLIPPTTAAVVQAILPIDPEVKKRTNELSAVIRQFNNQLRGICLRSANCFYVEVPAALLNGEGVLERIYHIGDGVHLNAAGYKIWIDHLQTNVMSLLTGK